MPRRAGPPRLKLREETRTWYIHYRAGGRERELSTGAREEDIAGAEAFFAAWLQDRGLAGGPRDPSQVAVGECLLTYAEQHAPTTADPPRIANAIEALLPFWRELKVSQITPPVSRRYVQHRLDQIVQRRIERAAAVKKRGKTPAPLRPASEGTPRRELGVLNAAVAWCVEAGMMPYGRAAELPEKPPARERWLTRQEAARALRAARRSHTGRSHLPAFIRIALRTGGRKDAILRLRWTQNTEGGWIDLERARIDFNPVGRKQTKKRRPVIPIPPGMLCWLKALRRNSRSDYVVERKLKRKGRPVGEPVGDVRQGVVRICAKAGLGKVTPHIFRHTAATWTMHDAVPIPEAAGYFGMSAETFERTYAHHHPDYMANVRKAMS